MNILEVSFLHPKDSKAGGVERFVNDLSEFLKPYYDISVAYCTTDKKESGATVNGVAYIPVYVCRFYPFRKYIYNLKLLRLTKTKHYHLVHINGDNGGMLAGYSSKVRSITTLHGNSMVSYNAVRGKIKNYLKIYRYLTSKISYYLEKRAVKKSDIVTAVSRSTADSFKTFGIDIRVIYNFSDFFHNIEDKTTVRNMLGLCQGTVYAIWVGGDPIRKGLNIAIDSISKTKFMKLIVCGVSGKNSERILYYGKVSDSQLIHLLNAADIFLFPSSYDAFSIAILEALQIGLTVIIGKNIGNAEILEGFGYVVEQDKDFSSVLIDIEPGRKRIFDRKVVSENFSRLSRQNIGREYLDLINEILNHF